MSGQLDCQIRLLQGSDILVSPRFTVQVEDCLTDSAGIESTSEYTALDSLFLKLQNLHASAATLPVGSAATVTKTTDDTSLNFHFGIPKGDQGIQGKQAFVHIKYSDITPTANGMMKDTPSDYIGIYSGVLQNPPTNYTDYKWFKYKGERGIQGVPGATYTLPTASFLTIGGVKVGEGLVMNEISGHLSVVIDNELNESSTFPVANLVITEALVAKEDVSNRITSLSIPGTDTQYPSAKCVYDKFAALSTVATSGSYNDLLNKPTAYVLPTASSTVLGGVKVGDSLKIIDGVLNANTSSLQVGGIYPPTADDVNAYVDQFLQDLFGLDGTPINENSTDIAATTPKQVYDFVFVNYNTNTLPTASGGITTLVAKMKYFLETAYTSANTFTFAFPTSATVGDIIELNFFTGATVPTITWDSTNTTDDWQPTLTAYTNYELSAKYKKMTNSTGTKAYYWHVVITDTVI